MSIGTSTLVEIVDDFTRGHVIGNYIEKGVSHVIIKEQGADEFWFLNETEVVVIRAPKHSDDVHWLTEREADWYFQLNEGQNT